MDMASQVHQALARMEDALEKNENRTAFSLFRKDIIKILCGAGVLKVCSPYYYKSGNIKMDKVAGELEGAFQYYYSGNGWPPFFAAAWRVLRMREADSIFPGGSKKTSGPVC